MWFMSLGWKLVRYGERLERSRVGFGGIVLVVTMIAWWQRDRVLQ